MECFLVLSTNIHFFLFSREQCDTKNMQVLQMLDLGDRSMITGEELLNNIIDYDEVHKIIGLRREQSLGVLIDELKGLENDRENKKNS